MPRTVSSLSLAALLTLSSACHSSSSQSVHTVDSGNYTAVAASAVRHDSLLMSFSWHLVRPEIRFITPDSNVVAISASSAVLNAGTASVSTQVKNLAIADSSAVAVRDSARSERVPDVAVVTERTLSPSLLLPVLACLLFFLCIVLLKKSSRT